MVDVIEGCNDIERIQIMMESMQRGAYHPMGKYKTIGEGKDHAHDQGRDIEQISLGKGGEKKLEECSRVRIQGCNLWEWGEPRGGTACNADKTMVG